MPTLLGLNDFTLRGGVLGRLFCGQVPGKGYRFIYGVIPGARSERKAHFDISILANRNECAAHVVVRREIAIAKGLGNFGKRNTMSCWVGVACGQTGQVVAFSSAVRVNEFCNANIICQVCIAGEFKAGPHDIYGNGSAVVHIDSPIDWIVAGCHIVSMPDGINILGRFWSKGGTNSNVKFGRLKHVDIDMSRN